MKHTLTVSEAAREAGIGETTLRFHADRRHIRSRRNRKGHRKFAPEEIQRFKQQRAQFYAEIAAQVAETGRIAETAGW